MYSKIVGNPKLLFISLLMLLVFIFTFLMPAQPYNEARAHNLENDLPVVGSLTNLEELLKKAEPNYYRSGATGLIMEDSMPLPEMSKTDSVTAEAQTNGFSSTNVQVAGVDEADLIKTDGKYIYQVNGQKLTIIKALPADDMQVVNNFAFSDPNFWASDLYVDDNYLIVMGRSHYSLPVPYPLPGPVLKPQADIYPTYYPANVQTSKVLIYNIEDKAHIKKLREAELQGSVVSSRKIGSSIYIAANRHINLWRTEQLDDSCLPAYRDSVTGSELNIISPDKIRYFPDSIYSSYIVTAALNLEQMNAPLEIKTYLGSGQNIYASLDNLYVAVSSYNRVPYDYRPETSSTSIYKFALKQGATEYAGKGSVPGTILNQFSMDEHSGFFRIATTSNSKGTDGMFATQNNVYVLNDKLQITGRLENIAPGENIYSTRFMGDRVYMVTFRVVDPFFVIDLKNPEKPQVLGQLKIPGYSDYLHPYDENHIIGFGKDTVEIKGWNGEPQSYYQGMKLAVFDVTDVNHPKEMARELIGDRGTDSELLRNHKALLFARDKNLLAFPLTLMEIDNNYRSPDNDRSILEYGRFTFQGAYIYNIDLTNGFKLKGRITHLSSEDYLKAGNYWYNSDKNISRIIYIGNTLYTISQKAVMAHDLNDMHHIKTISLP